MSMIDYTYVNNADDSAEIWFGAARVILRSNLVAESAPAAKNAQDYRGQLADVVRSPRYATVLGLLIEAKKQYLRGHIVTRQDGSVKAVWQRMKEWFLGNF